MKTFIKSNNKYIAKNDESITIFKSESDIKKINGENKINAQKKINKIISPMEYQEELREGHVHKKKINIKNLDLKNIEVKQNGI